MIMRETFARYFPHTLFGAYLIWFVLLGISPYSREVWLSENIPIVLIVATLVTTFKRFRFSNQAYFLMSILIFLHTLGSHYTFERVPFDWITNLFGFERNHFDRVAHFSVGFYAFAIVEFLCRQALVTRRWVAYLFGLFTILSVAALYEIIEWWFAVLADHEAGVAFLGSQGDMWDAQKDMLSDGLGAVTAIVLYHLRPPWRGRCVD
jgi:putative membrane protein